MNPYFHAIILNNRNMEKNEIEVLTNQISDLTEKIASLSNLILTKIGNKEPPKVTGVMNTTQAIEFIKGLAIPMSKSKLYKLTSVDNFPRMYSGNRMIFHREQLEEWCNKQIYSQTKTNNINNNSTLCQSALNKLK